MQQLRIQKEGCGGPHIAVPIVGIEEVPAVRGHLAS